MKKHLQPTLELGVVLVFSALPLFFDLSYQINLYLTWEGAYRLYEGQTPYADFGIPMGFCYWIVPALFFKLFGPSLFTLAKAQFFINIVSGVAFRSLLMAFPLNATSRFAAILVYALSFILGLQWPQYNHSVIVYQIAGLAFLMHYLTGNQRHITRWTLLTLSAFFLVFSFFTKQDAGALGILIALILVGVNTWQQRSYVATAAFPAMIVLFGLLWILPFTTDNIGYWFNYGQTPHHARISLYDLLSMMMNESRWEKIYVAIVLVVGIYRYFVLKVRDRVELIFTLLVLGILVEALIFQVTSYVPRNNNIFFHAFAASFILFHVQKTGIMKGRPASVLIVAAVLLWWSETYWKYADKVVSKVIQKPKVAEGVVDIHTYIITPDACNIYVNTGTWTTSELQTFRHVKMPASTVQGLDRVVRLARQLPPHAHILNMSELTPLAAEVPFELDKSVPLWYHLHVGMFDKELETYLDRIAAGYYDLVLFEDLPYLNNFYPFAVLEQLNAHYIEVDHFEAPRSVYPGTVKVYRRK